MQGDMDKKLKGIINAEALEDITSTANSRNIPPYDEEATAADVAYPLDRIILKGEWDYLLDVFELAQSGSEVNPDVYPSFVCNRFHKLGTVQVRIQYIFKLRSLFFSCFSDLHSLFTLLFMHLLLSYLLFIITIILYHFKILVILIFHCLSFFLFSQISRTIQGGGWLAYCRISHISSGSRTNTLWTVSHLQSIINCPQSYHRSSQLCLVSRVKTEFQLKNRNCS